MSGVTAGALSACNSSSSSVAASGASVYTAGTYTATAKGMNDITVTMTFSDTAITEVKVDTANETLDLAVNSAADFQTMLMEAQSAEIDGRFWCYCHLQRCQGSCRRLHPAGNGSDRRCRGRKHQLRR